MHSKRRAARSFIARAPDSLQDFSENHAFAEFSGRSAGMCCAGSEWCWEAVIGPFRRDWGPRRSVTRKSADVR
jgi:hypothetical protein